MKFRLLLSFSIISLVLCAAMRDVPGTHASSLKKGNYSNRDSFSLISQPQAGITADQQINDPQQEMGERVQNGTSSAVSGQNIVVAYNNIGSEVSAVSYSNDGGQSWQQTHVPPLAGGKNFGVGVVAARGAVFYYTGVALTQASVQVVIISRSLDGGRTWSEPSMVMEGSMVAAPGASLPW